MRNTHSLCLRHKLSNKLDKIKRKLRPIPVVCIFFIIGLILLPLPTDWVALIWSEHGSIKFFINMITHMFAHGNLMHLMGNYMFVLPSALWVEHKLGKKRFTEIWLFTGMIALFSHWMVMQLADGAGGVGIIGSSGACSGIFGAACFIVEGHPILKTIVRSMWACQLYVQVSMLIFAMQFPMAGGVAYAAHIGGMCAGAVIGHRSQKHKS